MDPERLYRLPIVIPGGPPPKKQIVSDEYIEAMVHKHVHQHMQPLLDDIYARVSAVEERLERAERKVKKLKRREE